MPWHQGYDPLNQTFLSTLAALFPAVLLLVCLSVFRIKAHLAAVIGLGATLFIAIGIFRMPAGMAAASVLFGLAYGFLPIGWIILNVIFIYQLCQQSGLFQMLQESLSSLTRDRRMQVLLIAFGFGAFLEGTAGFSTPVAVTSSIMVGLGFPSMTAAVLALIANTAPVPFAGLGTPVVALQTVTGLDLLALGGTIAWQLGFFYLLIPFMLVWVLAGWSGVKGVLPVILLTGGVFGTIQIITASLHGPWLVNILSALITLAGLALVLRRWQPRQIWDFNGEQTQAAPESAQIPTGGIWQAWIPWLILSLIMLVWGLPQVKTWLDSFSLIRIEIPGLQGLVIRMPPIVPVARVEAALFDFNWLSASGTGIFFSAVLAGLWMGFTPGRLLLIYRDSFRQVKYSLITIMVMMAIGFVFRYGGLDATLGLALAQTGMLYPFFGVILGWLGVFLTGSDTSSNVLFGSLQRITAEKLGIDPVQMAAANSSGGVMGKMISPQNLVVAAAATDQPGSEGSILRRVFWYSLVLACLMGVVVLFFTSPFFL